MLSSRIAAFYKKDFQNPAVCILKMPGSYQPLKFLSTLKSFLIKSESEAANTPVLLTLIPGALKENGRFYYSGLQDL